MKITIENLLLISDSSINTKKTYGELTYVTVHKDMNCNIDYVYNSKLNQWSSHIWTFDHETGTEKIKIHTFKSIEEIIKQIYYITGYGHYIISKK